MSRTIDLEGILIDGHDRLSIAHTALMGVINDAADLDRATAAAVNGAALVLRDVIEDMDEILREEPDNK